MKRCAIFNSSTNLLTEASSEDEDAQADTFSNHLLFELTCIGVLMKTVLKYL